MGCEDVRTQQNAAARKEYKEFLSPAPLRSGSIRLTGLRNRNRELNPSMDVDDFDDRSTYSLSSADETSSSDEEHESIELPGAELRIEGDFQSAIDLLSPTTVMLT